MKVSYAITVCNEEVEIKRLLNFLFAYADERDQIVVLYDTPRGTPAITEYLDSLDRIKLIKSEFKGDFAHWKNELSTHCLGDYIFQIDADEVAHPDFIQNLHTILDSNPDNDVFLIPRVNKVIGLRKEHVQAWNWKVNELGWVNWPDYQWRIWKNKPSIYWKNRVHERLAGFKTYATLPENEMFALYHTKEIDRQVRQNKFYSTLT